MFKFLDWHLMNHFILLDHKNQCSPHKVIENLGGIGSQKCGFGLAEQLQKNK